MKMIRMLKNKGLFLNFQFLCLSLPRDPLKIEKYVQLKIQKA
jgi:hypothetical protein